MSRTQNATRNLIWGFLNKVVVLVLPFVTRTLFIYTLGTLYLGLNGLFTSILQVMNISELGINSAITFSMYKPLAEKNTKEVNALLSFYRLCYRIIGVIVLVIGLSLTPILNKLIKGDVPTDINVYALYLVYLIGAFLSYELFSYRTALLVATQRNDIVSKVSSITAIGQFSLQLLILVYFKNYYLYIVVSNLTAIANNIICALICKRLYCDYKPFGKVDRIVLLEIRKKIGGMVFQKIGGVVLTSVDSIVISAFLGLQVLTVYQNYYFVISSLFGILAVIMGSLTATIGNSIVLESKEKNHNDFVKFNFLYIWIVGWCSICLICMYQPFIRIWVGSKLLLPFYMVILFAIYFLVHKWCDMLYVYQEACGIWWETRWVPIVAAVINLITNIILVNVIGLAGILISTIISVVFVYDVGYAKVLFITYFKDKELLKRYWIKQLLYLLSVVINATITYLICSIISFESAWASLIINGCICVIIPNVIFIILWKRFNEFSVSMKFIEGLILHRISRKHK